MAAQPKSEPIERTARAVAQHSRKVAASAVETKHAATETKHAAVAIEVSADLNTRLAADRNILAAERTYAAWVRTGLFALASGIGARALLQGVVPGWLVMADASLLIAFSTFCFGAGIWRELHPGPPPPRPELKPIPPALLIAVNAFLALVSLAALIGIWFGAPVAMHHLPPG
jgi:putative membrane protein